MFKFEPSYMANTLAALAGVISVGFILWVLTSGFNLNGLWSLCFAAIVGAIEFVAFRYLLSQKYYPDKETAIIDERALPWMKVTKPYLISLRL